MGNSDWAASPDLLFKGWKHTAVTAQNIAESDGHEARLLLLQAKDDEFGDTLGRTHDVGWLDGFVGRDHYEILDLERPRDQRYVVRAEDIVGYRLETVGFHHGNVFVRGGVKHGMRAMSGKDFPQHAHVQNVAYHRFVG